jgi:hypothetical protein
VPWDFAHMCCNCRSKLGPNWEVSGGDVAWTKIGANATARLRASGRLRRFPRKERAMGQETQTMRDGPAKTAPGSGPSCAAGQAIPTRRPRRIPQGYGNGFAKTGSCGEVTRGDRGGTTRDTGEGRPLSHSYLQETIESNERGEILARRPWRLWKAKPYEMQGT